MQIRSYRWVKTAYRACISAGETVRRDLSAELDIKNNGKFLEYRFDTPHGTARAYTESKKLAKGEHVRTMAELWLDREPSKDELEACRRMASDMMDGSSRKLTDAGISSVKDHVLLFAYTQDAYDPEEMADTVVGFVDYTLTFIECLRAYGFRLSTV